MTTPNVKELTRLWYEKLKEEGFDDIEDADSVSRPLKAWHSHKWMGISREKLEGITEYYLKATCLLHTYDFENDTHKKIWELHSEGLSKRKIEEALSQDAHTYKREMIGVIINMIAEEIK